MKHYLMKTGIGEEKIVPQDKLKIMEETSEKQVSTAMKAGISKDKAELLRWKIVKEIDCK